MSERAQRLRRLVAIRELSEELDRRALRLALAAVAEVENGIARQQSAQAESRLAACAALAAGDRSEWLLADAQAEVAGWNRGRLKGMLAGRTGAARDAMATFLESRIEHEQVKQLTTNAQQAERIEEDRRAQAAADDWFLSRSAAKTDELW